MGNLRSYKKEKTIAFIGETGVPCTSFETTTADLNLN